MNRLGAAAKPIKRYELDNKWFSLHDLRKSTSTKLNHPTILWLDDTFIPGPPFKADYSSHYKPHPNFSEVKLLCVFVFMSHLTSSRRDSQARTI